MSNKKKLYAVCSFIFKIFIGHHKAGQVIWANEKKNPKKSIYELKRR